MEKEGRAPPATLLSARDLSCSDQLKPCWSGREALSEGYLGCLILLACGMDDAAMPTLARRPARAAETLTPCAWPTEPLCWLCLRVG